MTVTYVAPHTASATWGEPIDGAGSTFVANRGRNIKVKVQLFVDGGARTSGTADLTVTPCGGGSSVLVPLSSGSGRWNASLDTSVLVGSCHTVAASIDGLAAGSFQLELRGAEPVKNGNPKPAATPAPTAKPASAPTAKPGPAPTAKPEKPAETDKPAKTDKPANTDTAAPAEKPAKTNNGKK